MDKIMGLRNAENVKESAAIAHAAASADEASGATTTKVGNATDDGLTSSSAAMDTQGDKGTVYAPRTFHTYATMRVETRQRANTT